MKVGLPECIVKACRCLVRHREGGMKLSEGVSPCISHRALVCRFLGHELTISVTIEGFLSIFKCFDDDASEML